ncbi:DUF6025 family protein [Pelagibius marinus]|uniref:DUF6025 family protein n=1 Tax=Pelagibius marinus TaxID=2762760 RepID=UPI001872476F|nr:DUF6025 family protein [Pelagibius marinus]
MQHAGSVHSELQQSPLTLLSRLGLPDETSAAAKLSSRQLERFDNRELAFDWVHMGGSRTKIKTLFEVLSAAEKLTVPRSGHLGNWGEIARGRSGALDFNNAICGSKKLGYPLLVDFNQTEDSELEKGDWAYLPGSAVSHGKRRELSLLTWNGAEFSERDRRLPYFVPFVMTRDDDEPLPLVEYHRRRLRQLMGYDFHFQSATLLKQEDLLRRTLVALIEDAILRRDQNALLRVFDRIITLDGRVHRNAIHLTGQRVILDETEYDTVAAFVDAALIPFKLAANPQLLAEEIRNLPPAVPLVSGPLMISLMAVMNTHYGDSSVERESMTKPFNPHFHWGARAIAGFPPRKRGYFRRSASIVRRIQESMIQQVDQLDPVFLILLPSAIFMLWPSSAYPRDGELVNDLVATILSGTADMQGDSEQLLQKIEGLVGNWVDSTGADLSNYFLSRFTDLGRPIRVMDFPEFSEPLEPEQFGELTLQQASMLVGALHEKLAHQAARILGS